MPTDTYEAYRLEQGELESYLRRTFPGEVITVRVCLSITIIRGV